ncbi:hypothetical protein KC571_03920, partial [candidate division WWE3 bacterium]|nr:hypothetical protein [candidate division WWE3 bacterium]
SLVLYLRTINWPYLFSLDQLALGGVIFTMLFMIILGMLNKEILIYPMINPVNPIRISAWWLFLLYADLIGVWYLLIRSIKYKGVMFWLFIASIPRILLLLTGLMGWLIISYSHVWTKKKSNNN